MANWKKNVEWQLDKSIETTWPTSVVGQKVPATVTEDIAPATTELVIEEQAPEPGVTQSPVNVEWQIAVTPPEPGITAAQAREQVVEKQEEAIAVTEKTADELAAETAKRIEKDKAREEERIKQEEEFRAQQAGIIWEADVAVAETQEEIDRLAKERAERDVTVIEDEAKQAANLNQAALELQKKKDEEAIFFAERNVEIEKQKSAWAFNKLWLSFSSWVILQSQDIATRWALQIATLKVQANFNQTKLQLEASKIQSDYTKETNRIIDKYTDIQIKNKQDIATRIENTNNNLLLNEEQKQAEINRLKDEFVSSSRELSDEMNAEQERLADKWIKQAQDLEGTLTDAENVAKDEFNRRVSNWTYFNLSNSEKNRLSQEMWIDLSEMEASVDTTINSAVRAMFDTIVWPDQTIPNQPQILSDIKWLLTKSGYSLERAINEVTLPQIRETEWFKAIEAEKERKETLQQLQIEKAKADIERTKWLTAAQKNIAKKGLNAWVSSASLLWLTNKITKGWTFDATDEKTLWTLADAWPAGKLILADILSTAWKSVSVEDFKKLSATDLATQIATLDIKEIQKVAASEERTLWVWSEVQSLVSNLWLVDTWLFDITWKSPEQITSDLESWLQWIVNKNPDITSEELIWWLTIWLPESKEGLKEWDLFIDWNEIKVVSKSEVVWFGWITAIPSKEETLININDLIK